MTLSRAAGGLFVAGILGLMAAVLLGPGTPGSYCIYGAISAFIVAAASFLLSVAILLYEEYRHS